MAKFKDFIEALQNDFNSARVLSDLQSAQLAKEYGNNDLLANLDFPVPRMKIKDVNIELSAFLKTSNKTKTNENQSEIGNIKIITDTRLYFSSSLKNFVKGEKQIKEVNGVLTEIAQSTINYSDRYIKIDLDLDERVSKITEYFSKKFEDSVIGIVKEYRDKIDQIYDSVNEYVLKENYQQNNSSENNSLDIEFSRNSDSAEFAPVKINITLADDDLIWEVDKKMASEL